MQQQKLNGLIWWIENSDDKYEEERDLLSQYYQVEIVANETATIADARQKKPDLVLSDVTTSKLEAFPLLHELRGEMATQEVPIVLLATDDKEELCLEGLEAGADDYLLKPFSGNELLARVKINLKTSRLRREAACREQMLRTEADKVQQQIAEILNSMTDAFVAFDREWRITYANRETTRINNMQIEEMLGKTCWEVWPYCVGTVLEREYRRAVAEQVAVHFELFYEPFSKWYEVHAYPFSEGLGVYSRDISDRKIAEEALCQSEERFRLATNAVTGIVYDWDVQTDSVYRSKGYDITKRKQDEEALRQSEERFRQMAENIENVFWMSIPSERWLLYVSPAYEKIWGRSRSSLYANFMEWIEAIHPEDRERVKTVFFERVLRGGFDEEYRVVSPDGEVRWVRDRAFPISAPDGQVYQVAGIAEDVTKRKQAEELLQETEERLRLALSSAQTIAWDMNLRTNWVVCSENALAVWGMQEGTTLDFIGLIHPSDRQSVIQATERAIAGEGAYQTEYRVIGPDGKLRWLHSKGKVHFDVNGQPERTIGVSVDVTERIQAAEALKESQERLKIALQTGRLGAWQLDLTTGILDSSDLCKANFGLPPEADLSYERFLELLHPEDRDCVREAIKRALEEKINYDVEYRNIWPDGSIHWVIGRGGGIYDADGVPYRMVGVTLDITDRKRIEEEREQLLASERAARASAETANRIKDEFLAVLSHELRSPLNPILGWVQLLRGSKKHDEGMLKKGLETIERNVKVQIQLIDDLLDIARILRGKLHLNMAPVDLVASVTTAIDTVRLAASSKSIQIETVIDSKLGQVNGNEARLQQIFCNLLSNAVKFTSSCGRVTVLVQRVEGMAQIQVKDTGKGISPDFLPYVFEQFRQADSSTTRDYGGLGLGLAIVRHLVELHGGTVKAESPGVGKGATFTVRLPLLDIHSQTLPDSQKIDDAPSLNGIRIMVVDDDPSTREFFGFALEHYGATVTTASSGPEALTLMTQLKFDILLSDIGMPEMDGYSLIRQVRSRSRGLGAEIPAIALTAYAGESDRQLALEAGFESHLAKPVNPIELAQLVARLTGG